MDILHKAFVIPLLLGSHIVTAVYKELGLTDSFFFLLFMNKLVIQNVHTS